MAESPSETQSPRWAVPGRASSHKRPSVAWTIRSPSRNSMVSHSPKPSTAPAASPRRQAGGASSRRAMSPVRTTKSTMTKVWWSGQPERARAYSKGCSRTPMISRKRRKASL